MVEQTACFESLTVKAELFGEMQTDAPTKQNVLDANVQALFVTPESILDSNWRKVLCFPTYRKRIRAVVIDKADCISHW